MTGIATVRDREVLSWETGAADYDLYVNGELTDGRAQKWVSLIAQLAGCDLQELSRMTILDIGCGPGFFPCVLGKQGACVVGVDKSSQMLYHARENLLAAGVDALLFHMDAHELDFPDNTFDLIVTRNVTWTLTDPQAAFAEWRAYTLIGNTNCMKHRPCSRWRQRNAHRPLQMMCAKQRATTGTRAPRRSALMGISINGAI